METDLMKLTPFSLFLMLLIVATLYPLSSFAQDYTRWGLPEGAKARIGKGTIRDMQYSPDGAILAVASSVGIWLYDAKTYQELSLLGENAHDSESVSFSPDGTTLVSGNDDTITLWDVAARKHKKTIDDVGSSNPVVFSPDGLIFASTGHGSIWLWDTETGGRKGYLAKPDYISCIAFSPNGHTLASGGLDDTVRLWDIDTGRQMHLLKRHRSSVFHVVFSPDGQTIVSWSNDRTLRFWDVRTGKYKKSLSPPGSAQF